VDDNRVFPNIQEQASSCRSTPALRHET
jgi:hypothetical protein